MKIKLSEPYLSHNAGEVLDLPNAVVLMLIHRGVGKLWALDPDPRSENKSMVGVRAKNIKRKT